jgi:hypothetical protein
MITADEQSIPKRFHPRVDAPFMVKVVTNGRALIAKAKDLSMAGLCLLGAPNIADQVRVTIPLPGDREVVTRATVKRRAQGYVALEFAQLDWDDMFALARYLHPRL